MKLGISLHAKYFSVTENYTPLSIKGGFYNAIKEALKGRYILIKSF